MKKSRWLLVFNLLVIYIFIQFVWWSILIANQLKEIYGNTAVYQKKLMMIFGEGFVFMAILIVGIYFVRRSFKKEIELSTQQKNFLLAVTHELKTPIAVSKLSLQTIANRQLDPEKQKNILEKAINETDRLNALIENIVLTVKLDEKNIELQTSNINLSELVQKQVEMLHHTIGQNHKLELSLEEQVNCWIDVHYFPSVISNLYENATKYTPAGSTIGFSVQNKNGRAELLIWDNGPGIDEKDPNKIFERFYRSGNEETRIAKGTGLGLFITKQLVEMHKATIVCRKNQPQGTQFLIQF
jgi:signal transduction histidine kinase